MDVDVLVCGGGPTGLVVAIELARRGVAVRIVDRDGPLAGSRGDGVQPRTLEVFDQLGVLDRVLAEARPPSPVRVRVDGQHVEDRWRWELFEPTAATPHPNPVALGQNRTERILAARLAEFGVEVERGRTLTSLAQDADGATAVVDGETVRAGYVVGADGGSSTVRKAVGVGFPGVTDEDFRMTLGDVQADLDPSVSHYFALSGNVADGVALTPLESGFQMHCSVEEPTLAAFQSALDDRMAGVVLRELTWSTVWRPNVRLADEFVVGRVVLAGDAAHVHPPTGGQGLNTGVQDAFNLGWKLAEPTPELLASYAEERRAVAEDVLGLSTRLLDKHRNGDEDAMRRGPEGYGLGIHYRDSPLTRDFRPAPGSLRAGDRVPGGGLGPQWTLARSGGTDDLPGVRTVDVDWGIDEETYALVRPDGYIARMSHTVKDLK